MNKSQIPGNDVKEKLAEALISLLRDRHISDISVSTLIEEAGVARASFYRNFSSLEDILKYELDQLVDIYNEKCPFPFVDFSSADYMKWLFGFYMDYREGILALERNGLSSMLLEVINEITLRHNRFSARTDRNDLSGDRFRCYFEAGAFYNIVIHWLLEEEPRPVEDIARAFCATIK